LSIVNLEKLVTHSDIWRKRHNDIYRSISGDLPSWPNCPKRYNLRHRLPADTRNKFASSFIYRSQGESHLFDDPISSQIPFAQTSSSKTETQSDHQHIFCSVTLGLTEGQGGILRRQRPIALYAPIPIQAGSKSAGLTKVTSGQTPERAPLNTLDHNSDSWAIYDRTTAKRFCSPETESRGLPEFSAGQIPKTAFRSRVDQVPFHVSWRAAKANLLNPSTTVSAKNYRSGCQTPYRPQAVTTPLNTKHIYPSPSSVSSTDGAEYIPGLPYWILAALVQCGHL
jgi:hypothetical protein